MNNHFKFVRFNPRERKFLELYFCGCKMKDAAIGAGYAGKTPQSLCNTARKILNKFANNGQAFFRLAGPREMRVAQLLSDMAFNGKSGLQQLKALKILAGCYFS